MRALLKAMLWAPCAALGLELHVAFEGVPRGNGARELAAIELFARHCPELEMRHIRGSTQRNILCVLPGPGEPVLVGAYYYRIGSGAGIVDNWSDVLMASELLRDLAHREGTLIGLAVLAPRIRWMSGDWEPFRRKGLPILNLHSMRPRDERAVHTSKDRADRIRVDHWGRTLELVSRVLWSLDKVATASAGSAEAPS